MQKAGILKGKQEKGEGMGERKIKRDERRRERMSESLVLSSVSSDQSITA